MIQEVVTGTNIVYYMMIMIGVIGVMAKIANHLTLRRLLTAASSMSKSTHKLIKLVRAKYEHACMLHDKVENTRVFVEKYIYEYRGFLFRIHTWRQLELQSVWFAGILAVIGAFFWYGANGICEEVYQYLMVGAAEMIALYVISQLSDEPYKVEAVKNYMVDYLENTSTLRYRRGRQSEREQIDIIRTVGNDNSMAKTEAVERREATPELSINIEGEPRKNAKEQTARSVFRKTAKGKGAQLETAGEGKMAFSQGEEKVAFQQGEGKMAFSQGEGKTAFSQGEGKMVLQPDEGGMDSVGRGSGLRRAYQAEAGGLGQNARQAYQGESEELYRAERPLYKVEQPSSREEQPSVREEQLRQILEEFLA